jgi:glycerol-3-phosphate dehydrogenase (NAD(P)+)
VSVQVFGAGSWGTALAVLLAATGKTVRLWGRNPEVTAEMARSRENRRYLPGVRLPDSLTVASGAPEAPGDDVILAVPTRAQREVARALASRGAPLRVLCAAKGYEPGSRLRMSTVLREELAVGPGIAVLAGPSHAEEVARSIPTTVVVSSEDQSVAITFQRILFSPTFRVYTNLDLLGVETAAALKNVIAIAAGICDGLGFGDNTKGALLTRGLAEITRLGEALGARADTFYGLAGIGDLITTCMSRHSRNRNVGELLGRGRTLEQATRETGMVAEGVNTTRSAIEIARERGVELPITEKVAEILFEKKDPRVALSELMGRDAKAEVR